MNKQEAFNKIYLHAQKKVKSFDVINLKCSYRGPNGAKCFIGCLIPDEVCPAGVDYGVSLVDILPLCGVDLGKMGLNADGIDEWSVNYHFYHELQLIHDSNEPNDWNYALKEFANEYKLEIPV